MAKDAGGHGSEKRGGSYSADALKAYGQLRASIKNRTFYPTNPNAAPRVVGAHPPSPAVDVAEQHGIDTSHLVGYVPPSRPGDQSPTHNSQGHEWGSPAALSDFKAEHGGPRDHAAEQRSFNSGKREINRLKRQGK